MCSSVSCARCVLVAFSGPNVQNFSGARWRHGFSALDSGWRCNGGLDGEGGRDGDRERKRARDRGGFDGHDHARRLTFFPTFGGSTAAGVSGFAA